MTIAKIRPHCILKKLFCLDETNSVIFLLFKIFLKIISYHFYVFFIKNVLVFTVFIIRINMFKSIMSLPHLGILLEKIQLHCLPSNIIDWLWRLLKWNREQKAKLKAFFMDNVNIDTQKYNINTKILKEHYTRFEMTIAPYIWRSIFKCFLKSLWLHKKFENTPSLVMTAIILRIVMYCYYRLYIPG